MISGWRVTLGLALLLSSWGVFAWGDSDGDGVPDNKDACPGTQTQMPVSANGCVLDKAFSLTDICLPTTAAGARLGLGADTSSAVAATGQNESFSRAIQCKPEY